MDQAEAPSTVRSYDRPVVRLLLGNPSIVGAFRLTVLVTSRSRLLVRLANQDGFPVAALPAKPFAWSRLDGK
jgi:hypothetical protein